MRLDLYAEGGYSGGGITENGGNISGPLLLAGNPSQTLEAVPKQYVDAYYNSINAGNLTAGTLPAARLPNFTGDLQSSPGTTQLTLNNSGVTAGEYSKVTVNSKGIVTGGSNINDSDIPFGLNWSKINQGSLPSTLSGYGITNGVSVNGATMLGFLTISNEPTLGSHIATKQYVDSLISNGGIAVGDILRKPYSTTPTGFLKCNGAEVDKTTYADLYSVIGNQYTINNIIGNGQPWKQQYLINSAQSNDITGWSVDSSALPNGLYYSQAIVTKNRVYMFGGWNGVYTNAVLTAPINADGTLGTWVAGTALPSVMSLSISLVTKNRVYMIGGYSDNGTQISTVYTAVINSDGTLGTWTTGTSLPAGLGWSSGFVTKNRVYICGGHTVGSVPVSSVYTATISSDGIIGNWTTGPSLPQAGGGHSCVVIKNRVYLLGSYQSYNIHTAIINEDGTLGNWVTSGSLPNMLANSQAFATRNRLYLLGGNNGSTYVSTVYTCPINSDGTLGTWEIGTSLPIGLGTSAVICTKNKVYLLGGQLAGGTPTSSIYSAPINGGLNDYSEYYSADTSNYLMPGSGRPWQQQYQINASQSGAITGWTTGTALPITIGYSQTIVTKNRVYVIGGYNGSSLSNVYTAEINADGTLGAWSSATSLPTPFLGTQAIVTKNRVYLLGGYNGTAWTGTVYTAVINSDGTLGAWSTATSLPAPLGYSQAVITKNRVYLLGGVGVNGGTVATVYTAPIDADGIIGAWTTGTSLNVGINFSTAVVTKNRVYLLGGDLNAASNNYTSVIYTATINSDGILGPWTTAGNLPMILAASQSIVFKNRVYLFGGSNLSVWQSSIYSAPINEDGTLGAWTTNSSLPAGLTLSTAIATKNRIYTIGGHNTSVNAVSNIVYTASILEGLNDYSPYYDGSITPLIIVNNTNKFRLPDLTADEAFGSYSYIKY